MAITPLPPSPSRSDPTNFSDEADALLSALPTFVTECNATAAAMDLNDTTSTSVTSLLIEVASKALTVDISKSYQPGMSIKIARTASPSNWMHGDVTTYNAGTGALVVNVTSTLGSGTFTDWTITLSAPQAPFATATDITTGTEAAKAIAPDQLKLSSPSVVTVKCTGLTDLKVPKHTSDAVGLADTTITVSANNEVTNASQPCFSVKPNVAQTNIAVGSAVTVVFDVEVFDVGSNFASNTFTAPITGKYQLNASIYLGQIDSAATYYRVKLVTSNREYISDFDVSKFSGDVTYWTIPISVLADMDAGDTAYLAVTQTGGTQQTTIQNTCYFSGHLVC